MRYLTALTLLALLIAGCTSTSEETEDGTSNFTEFDETNLADHIQYLASDKLMGRMPFTEGGELTEKYIKEQFEEVGVKPGNGDSYFQEVGMVELNAKDMSDMVITGNGQTLELEFKKEFVATTRQIVPSINVEGSEVVFAGFGVVAPEYNWDDYANLDVEGKTVVVLVNDPGFGPGNEDIFNDEAMTYYGRWTYKYEEAARQGAAAVLVVHETEPASYPWGVVENGWTGPQLHMVGPDSNKNRCEVEGWISLDVANRLFAAAGKEGYDFREEARKVGFKSFSLDMTMSVSFNNTMRSNTSNNVIGIIPGTERPDEYIIYTGHWDHLGVGTPVDGDSIYNGAIDNATGIAVMIEMGRHFAEMEDGPKRSIVLLAVTAEEQGLIGSSYYAANPIYPPAQTVANINMDAILAYGKMKDVTVVGFGQSELDSLATAVAEDMGRYTQPNPHPEAGYYYRSDHFNFANIGVPALYAKGNSEHMTEGKAFADSINQRYRNELYHKVTDEYVPEEWDMSGLAFEGEYLYEVGKRLAQSNWWPEWSENSEFRAIREASRKGS